MNNITDNLIDEVIRNKSSVVVGLDPIMSRIPYCYKIKYL